MRSGKGRARALPTVRQSFARTGYFEELDKRVAGNKRLPVWEGELYFEYHRGTYTSMAQEANAPTARRSCTMMDLELLSVLASGPAALPGGRTGRHVENRPAQSVPRYSSRLVHS